MSGVVAGLSPTATRPRCWPAADPPGLGRDERLRAARAAACPISSEGPSSAAAWHSHSGLFFRHHDPHNHPVSAAAALGLVVASHRGVRRRRSPGAVHRRLSPLTGCKPVTDLAGEHFAEGRHRTGDRPELVWICDSAPGGGALAVWLQCRGAPAIFSSRTSAIEGQVRDAVAALKSVIPRDRVSLAVLPRVGARRSDNESCRQRGLEQSHTAARQPKATTNAPAALRHARGCAACRGAGADRRR